MPEQGTKDPSLLTDDEITDEVASTYRDIQERSARAADAEREFTDAEQHLNRANTAWLGRLKAEADKREKADQDAQVQHRARQLGDAMGQAVADRAAGDLEVHFRTAGERALAGEGYRFTLGEYARNLELRSTTTALAGASTSVASGGDTGGIWLPRESGSMNLRLRPGERLESGVWPANAAVSATSEGGTKPTLDPASLGTDVVSPYAVSSNVTIQSEAAGRGIEQFTWSGTRRVRRSVNDAFTSAMVTAGGTARTFDTDVVTSVDGALSEMMAVAATVPTLVIVDPAHFSALATAGGDDATDSFPSFRGVRLVSSAVAGLAGHALIIDGSAVSHSMSGVEVRTQPQVISNSTDVVVEVWFAVTAYGASGVTLQDLVV